MRRDWFLANLGIVRYVPREEVASREGVPHDGSPDQENPREVALRRQGPDSEAVAATPPANPVPASGESERRDRPRPRVDLGDPAPSPVPAPVAARERQADAEPFLCRIGFWHPTSTVAVLSAMPPGQRPTPVQLTMLANLLKAIGALEQDLPAVDLIDWPPSSGFGLQEGAGLAAARDYLGVFLQAKQHLRNFDTVLLMGDVAARICGDDEPFEAGRQLDFPGGVRAIVTHSLHDMEKAPALKGETWQAIRFLAG